MGQAQSVAVGHLNVGNHQVHAAIEFLNNLKSVGTIFGLQRLEMLPFQDCADLGKSMNGGKAPLVK
jgi:hypothetical protein